MFVGGAREGLNNAIARSGEQPTEEQLAQAEEQMADKFVTAHQGYVLEIDNDRISSTAIRRPDGIPGPKVIQRGFDGRYVVADDNRADGWVKVKVRGGQKYLYEVLFKRRGDNLLMRQPGDPVHKAEFLVRKR